MVPHQHPSLSAPVGGVTMAPGTLADLSVTGQLPSGTDTDVEHWSCKGPQGIWFNESTHLIVEVIRTLEGLQSYPRSHSYLMARLGVGAQDTGHTLSSISICYCRNWYLPSVNLNPKGKFPFTPMQSPEGEG